MHLSMHTLNWSRPSVNGPGPTTGEATGWATRRGRLHEQGAARPVPRPSGGAEERISFTRGGAPVRLQSACTAPRNPWRTEDGGRNVNGQESAGRAPTRRARATARPGGPRGVIARRHPDLRRGTKGRPLLDHPVRTGRTRPPRARPSCRGDRNAGPRRTTGLVLAVPAAHLASRRRRDLPGGSRGVRCRAVCALCDEDAELGRALYRYVAETVAARLRGTRTRLLALYGPQSGNRAGAAHETDIGQDLADI